MEKELHRRNPTAVKHRCAQRCESKNEHSSVTAMVRIVMLQHWQWQRWDISDYDTDTTAMFTFVWKRWQLTLLWQRWQPTVLCQRWQLTPLWQRCLHFECDSDDSWQCCDSSENWQRCQSGGSWQRCHSDVYISVTALSVATTFTVMCTSLSR